jgi:hypothetical protein
MIGMIGRKVSLWILVVASTISALSAKEKYKIKKQLCLYAIAELVADKTHPILHPLQAGVGYGEVDRKYERIRGMEDKPEKLEEWLEERWVPIVRHILPSGEEVLYFRDHHHESKALLKRHLEEPKDKRFKYVFGSVELTLREPSQQDLFHTLYLNGMLFPFNRSDDFMDREGRILKAEDVVKGNFLKQIPPFTSGLADNKERTFGALVRDELEIPHHLTMLEFRLARAAIMRWKISQQMIDDDMKEAVKRAAKAANDDEEFIEKHLLPGVEFQK